MASEVDICNLALGLLGDSATVSSINPPEGSAQAQHCARFYTIARNTLLEMATWSFATRRAPLAQLDNSSTEWQFAYAMPAGVVNVIAVLPPDATDDYSQTFSPPDVQQFPLGTTEIDLLNSTYTPQPYTVEVNDQGQSIILTNVENAVMRYTVTATDSAKFSPLFVVALSWLLASMLAGPLIKGDAGAAEAKRCLQMFQVFEAQAEASDANQRNVTARQIVPWISGR